MKCSVEMESGAVTYIPSFIKIGSGIQKVIGGFTGTQTAWTSHKPAFIFQNKESSLKKEMTYVLFGTPCLNRTIGMTGIKQPTI
jgi:hypothetical protein